MVSALAARPRRCSGRRRGRLRSPLARAKRKRQPGQPKLFCSLARLTQAKTSACRAGANCETIRPKLCNVPHAKPRLTNRSASVPHAERCLPRATGKGPIR
jgi:hypothetical protein